jgi:hypothetical protein
MYKFVIDLRRSVESSDRSSDPFPSDLKGVETLPGGKRTWSSTSLSNKTTHLEDDRRFTSRSQN